MLEHNESHKRIIKEYSVQLKKIKSIWICKCIVQLKDIYKQLEDMLNKYAVDNKEFYFCLLELRSRQNFM